MFLGFFYLKLNDTPAGASLFLLAAPKERGSRGLGPGAGVWGGHH